MRKPWLWLGLVVLPFGPLDPKLAARKSWSGFDAQGPELLLVVARRFGAEEQVPSDCRAWQEGLQALPEARSPWGPEYSAWGAWDSEARSQVDGCDGFPCDVKLDESEVSRMAAVPREKRLEVFLRQLAARSEVYLATSARPDLEWPGGRVEPWSDFEKEGLRSPLTRPSVPELVVRKLDIAPGRMKPVRQILDRRLVANREAATLWVRDVYSDHFFDAWGEWLHAECHEAKPATAGESARPGSVDVTLALRVELDLLKQTDLLSRLGRSRMRSGFESHGKKYLERELELALARAREAERRLHPALVAPASIKLEAKGLPGGGEAAVPAGALAPAAKPAPGPSRS